MIEFTGFPVFLKIILYPFTNIFFSFLE